MLFSILQCTGYPKKYSAASVSSQLETLQQWQWTRVMTQNKGEKTCQSNAAWKKANNLSASVYIKSEWQAKWFYTTQSQVRGYPEGERCVQRGDWQKKVQWRHLRIGDVLSSIHQGAIQACSWCENFATYLCDLCIFFGTCAILQ